MGVRDDTYDVFSRFKPRTYLPLVFFICCVGFSYLESKGEKDIYSYNLSHKSLTSQK